ncbi:hypothetical protein K7432_010117 [Basidiobolus ranarum]|uniref:Small EDRK-rich factor-like N-terminal domain-containing protein n=1 Tax=Basidiobolus ranarum TaxID=34480 RepID=A0ABR2WP85_9FUNG
MTRGNQREKDRERAAKKLAKANKGNKDSSFKKRAESDAEIMRQKQQKALEAKEAGK